VETVLYLTSPCEDFEESHLHNSCMIPMILS
jgi:hypothetical protein